MIPSFGRTAARNIGDLIYKTVLANPSSFFASGNGNLLTGAGSALSVTALSAAVKAMRTHRDIEGNSLDILPALEKFPKGLAVRLQHHFRAGRDFGQPINCHHAQLFHQVWRACGKNVVEATDARGQVRFRKDPAAAKPA